MEQSGISSVSRSSFSTFGFCLPLIIGLENDASLPQPPKNLGRMLNFKHANNLWISLKLNEDIILWGIQEFYGTVKTIYYSYFEGI